ncbi:MAG: glycoside hydrolase family 140 protein [Verrucomicrobia bacterium]|nr:glycoside hydrolase family 140 protein [Verrucomicrobiota bacterium]
MRPNVLRSCLALGAAGMALAGCSQGVSSLGDLAETGPAVAFPLKVDPSNRYLVDQHDVPFLIHGDAPWSLIAALTRAEAERYLQARRSQGFNALLVNLVEHHFGGADNKNGAPFNREGQAPFLAPGDFTRPNEAYFAHADWVLQRAGKLGFVVFLFPSFTGCPGTEEGWYRELKANDVEACRKYGRYLGRRYAKLKNIVWVAGGDRNPEDVRAQILALVGGIRELDPDKLWTADCFRENSAVDQYGDQPWLALNAIYTYQDVPGKCLGGYFQQPARPSFLVESHYEDDFGRRNGDDTRKQAWLAVLSGACGQFFGNLPVWQFGNGWSRALNSPGARYQAYLRRCLVSRHWENLVPESGRRLLPEGLGAGADRKAAAVTRDRLTGLIYLPAGGKVAVDLSALEGPRVRAWWFNPRDGTNREEEALATDGRRHTFSTPDGGDWVLVLDSVAHEVSPPGTRNIFAAAPVN